MGHIDYTDKSSVLQELESGSIYMGFVSDDLLDDKEVMMSAVSKDGSNIRFASLRLRDDRDLFLTVLESSRTGTALLYASDRLKEDRQLALLAVRKTGWVIGSLAWNLRTDAEIIAVSRGIRSL